MHVGRRLLRLSHRRGTLLDRHQPIEAAEGEGALHLSLTGHDSHGEPVRARPVPEIQDRLETDRVDECQPAEVEDEAVEPVVGRVVHATVELLARGDVELAAYL